MGDLTPVCLNHLYIGELLLAFLQPDGFFALPYLRIYNHKRVFSECFLYKILKDSSPIKYNRLLYEIQILYTVCLKIRKMQIWVLNYLSLNIRV